MRTFITALCTTVCLGVAGVAIADPNIDESTNPNSNRDTPTQNLQQKPNGVPNERLDDSNSKPNAKVQRLRQKADGTENATQEQLDHSTHTQSGDVQKLHQKPE